jgi:hypothetical protein
MGINPSINSISLDEIEMIEKLSLRWVMQAVLDFDFEAYDIFFNSPDNIKDIAEDVTREILDRLPGFNISQRIFGTVDYKKARYIILPNQIVRQALFVDSKAEKEERSATLQLSQTSMAIRQVRSGKKIEIKGTLPPVYIHNGIEYLTTTLFLHYFYQDMLYNDVQRHILKHVTLFCVPNGKLQERYNPNEIDSFWLAGRNAPSRGEEFRVRVSFSKLKEKARWRVQRIYYDAERKIVIGTWEE